MSLINDYTSTLLAAERRRDLVAAAERDHLLQQARAGRTTWWHRLFGPTSPSRQPLRARPTVRPAHPTVVC